MAACGAVLKKATQRTVLKSENAMLSPFLECGWPPPIMWSWVGSLFLVRQAANHGLPSRLDLEAERSVSLLRLLARSPLVSRCM